MAHQMLLASRSTKRLERLLDASSIWSLESELLGTAQTYFTKDLVNISQDLYMDITMLHIFLSSLSVFRVESFLCSALFSVSSFQPHFLQFRWSYMGEWKECYSILLLLHSLLALYSWLHAFILNRKDILQRKILHPRWYSQIC